MVFNCGFGTGHQHRKVPFCFLEVAAEMDHDKRQKRPHYHMKVFVGMAWLLHFTLSFWIIFCRALENALAAALSFADPMMSPFWSKT